MSRTFPIVLLFLGLGLLLRGPLLAEDDPRAAQKKALAEAEEEFDAAEDAYKEILKELEHNFKVVRGERWPKVAPKFEFAIEQEVELLREKPEYDLLAGLKGRFFDISVLCEVINGRLAKAIEGPVREAAKAEGEVDSAGILAAGLKVVFPEETFADCFDNHFMDIPHITRYDEADEALMKARFELEKPVLPPLPKCDGPTGTVFVPKGRFTFGPWTGWDIDIEKNKEAKLRGKAFYIHAFEVTNLQYLEFLEGLKDSELVEKYLPPEFSVEDDGTITLPQKARWLPVTGITYTAANAFAESIGMRLPTEEEWEYAARGEDGHLYPWGAEYKKGYANSSERGFDAKRVIGSHPKDRSPFGVYDMAGNVSEMTSNLTGRRLASEEWEATDDIIWRGGNYFENKDALQTIYRWTIKAAGGTADEVGFRCVISETDWKAKAKK